MKRVDSYLNTPADRKYADGKYTALVNYTREENAPTLCISMVGCGLMKRSGRQAYRKSFLSYVGISASYVGQTQL